MAKQTHIQMIKQHFPEATQVSTAIPQGMVIRVYQVETLDKARFMVAVVDPNYKEEGGEDVVKLYDLA